MNAPANMQSRVQDYLDERRRLGFQLKSVGRTLMNFAQFVDTLDQAGPLTLDVMIEWARQDKPGCHSHATSARRFKLLRPFARYLQQFEPATAIPDEAVFGPIPGWQMPHIYRDQEVVDLLAAARGLGPAGDLRAATYETLFGLIAATGLRLSEAVHLLDADVDLMLGLLTVRQISPVATAPKYDSRLAALPAAPSPICPGTPGSAVFPGHTRQTSGQKAGFAPSRSRFQRAT
jgi:site-specific recombinase XerD